MTIGVIGPGVCSEIFFFLLKEVVRDIYQKLTKLLLNI